MSYVGNVASPSVSRERPRLLFATLVLGLMPQGLGLMAVPPVLPEMAQAFGSRGALVAQMMMSLIGLGLMLGGLASGWILDRLGPRRTLLTSLLLFAVGGSAGLFLRAPLPLLASRFVVGFVSACAATTCLSGISAQYTGTRRARALGIASALSAIAGLLSTLLSGWLAHLGGWSLAFIQFPVFGFGVFLVALVGFAQIAPLGERLSRSGRSDYHGLAAFFLMVVLLFAIMSLGGTQLPFLLQEEGLREPAVRSMVLAAPTVTATLSSFGYGSLRKVVDARGTLTLTLGTLFASQATIGLGSNASYAAVGAVLGGCCVGIVGPCLFQIVADRAPERSRGQQLGMLSAVMYLGIFLNPIVFAPMADVIGSRGVFGVSALIAGVLACLTALNVVLPARDSKRVQTNMPSEG
jgi:MFS family permease